MTKNNTKQANPGALRAPAFASQTGAVLVTDLEFFPQRRGSAPWGRFGRWPVVLRMQNESEK